MPTYRLADVTLCSARRLPGLVPGPATRSQWQIHIRRFARGPVDWYHRAVLPPDNRVCQLIGRAGTCHIVRFPGTAIFAIDPRRRQIFCQADGDVMPSIASVAHLLVAQVMPLVLSARRLCLHGSAVQGKGGAVAFVGVSGRGKSTVAAALATQGWRLVADDCLVLKTARERTRVTPFQAGVRLWPDAASAVSNGAVGASTKMRFAVDQLRLEPAQSSSPLRRVYLLHPRSSGGTVHSTPVRGREAVIALLQATSQIDSDRPAVRRDVFERLTAVVKGVDIRKLTYPQRLSALHGVIDVVKADARDD